MSSTVSPLDPVDTFSLLSILADQPRSIDRFIDYFGNGKSAIDPAGRSDEAISR